MARNPDDVITAYCVSRLGVTDPKMQQRITDAGLKSRQEYEPDATSFNDLAVKQPDVIEQWCKLGFEAVKAADEEAKHREEPVTPFQIKEAALLETIARGKTEKIRLEAQTPLVRLYQDELKLTPAAAAQAANRKLAEHGMKLGNVKPVHDFKLDKNVRKALKAAAAANEIERAPRLPRPGRPDDAMRKSNNPYLLPEGDPTRMQKIIAVAGSSSQIASSLAKAAGCRIDGRPLA